MGEHRDKGDDYGWADWTYGPKHGHADPKNPPKGGSGVPPPGARRDRESGYDRGWRDDADRDRPKQR